MGQRKRRSVGINSIKPYDIHSSITTYNTAVMPTLMLTVILMSAPYELEYNVIAVRPLPFYMQRCIIDFHSFIYITSIPYCT
jgi:hypothetical protein